jgi:hypothetical protein
VKSFHSIRSVHLRRPIRPALAGLAVAALAPGLLLVGSAPASAQKAEHVSVKPSTTTVRPPVLTRPRFRCHDSFAVVVVKLRNPNQTVLFFEVRLSAGDYQEALPVMLLSRGVDSVEFHGAPNGRYLIEVLNDVGDYVADTRVKVRCKS